MIFRPKGNSSTAKTVWIGDLKSGGGVVSLSSRPDKTFPVRWEIRESGTAPGLATTPEELLAAAHSSCYSMALANALDDANANAVHFEASATVDFEVGAGVTSITIAIVAEVCGITDEEFRELAVATAEGCPVSVALRGVPISVIVSGP